MPVRREPFQRLYDRGQHVFMDYEGNPAYREVPTSDEDHPIVDEKDNGALLKGEIHSAGEQRGLQCVSVRPPFLFVHEILEYQGFRLRPRCLTRLGMKRPLSSFPKQRALRMSCHHNIITSNDRTFKV